MARLALLEAEQRVIQMLRTRCEMVRQRAGRASEEMLLRAANFPAYMEQIVDTVPDDLNLADFLCTPQFADEPTAPARPIPQQTH